MTPTAPILEARGLEASYDGAAVLHGVGLRVSQGEIVALLGPNGAGKTTTLRCLSGVLAPSGGSIVLDGKDVTGRSAQDFARSGVALVPEGRGIFRALTVAENLRLSSYLLRRDPARRRAQLERVLGIFPELADRTDQAARTLSGGQQQMLAIARALMSSPRILLVDEASLGLAPIVVERLYEVLAELNRDGMTLVVVEQSTGFVLGIAHRAYVMQKGTIVFEGSGEKLGTGDLLSAYLG